MAGSTWRGRVQALRGGATSTLQRRDSVRGDARPDARADAAANAISVACAHADDACAHAHAAAHAAAAVQAWLWSHHHHQHNGCPNSSTPRPVLDRRLLDLSLWYVRRRRHHVP